MGAASERMQNLISDLLDLARVNSRGRELVPIALAEVAREVVSTSRRASPRSATIEIEQLPVVLGDRVQLRQILQNLIGNALKFHRADVPLKVRVTTEASEGGRCTVAVEDNGIGFDERYADRIFGTFQRLHGRGVRGHRHRPLDRAQDRVAPRRRHHRHRRRGRRRHFPSHPPAGAAASDRARSGDPGRARARERTERRMTHDPEDGVTILLADDDVEDRAMTIRRAARSAASPTICASSTTARSCCDYLFHRGAYAEPGDAPRRA